MKLKDKVALVIGGTSGIGEATAKAYAEEGAKVIVGGRKKDEGDRIVREIREAGGTAIFAKVDTTKADEVEAAVQTAQDEYGTLDILYNGAGIHDSYQTALDISEEDYDQLMAVNVKGPYLATKAALPVFLEKGKGTIVNVGSQATHVAGPGGSAYVTSKHALEGFTKQLAYDFGSKGIKANLLAPGFVETPMTEGIEEERLKDIPAERAGKPEEVARLAVFLASDDSNYMHGTSVTMDGGWVVGR
ncbi:SDR family NAD(P)-dependent oxidoreductase [Alkalibacterium pelagium]|jgi:3-oxoacyl-[acyl-carrier protein] reductase|uniref:3-oxoacyl-[acyl-carrier protein] reductase n=1 Tax=Alkalibacterium pelagium TaxID=426702 RepID=A0A1H7HL41_9LACT|nr:SDR family NAD(P)-dependent oxidoreductase [Alkalibacterium pelagium]GEN50427.1 3-ketoacyl-ACP reductase [Alkalibacterium pelagium]SEK50192.1 3-oxoacyl-[acyl-carrier protein] reductase [Alkalibacterium pelagium]